MNGSSRYYTGYRRSRPYVGSSTGRWDSNRAAKSLPPDLEALKEMFEELLCLHRDNNKRLYTLSRSIDNLRQDQVVPPSTSSVEVPRICVDKKERGQSVGTVLQKRHASNGGGLGTLSTTDSETSVVRQNKTVQLLKRKADTSDSDGQCP